MSTTFFKLTAGYLWYGSNDYHQKVAPITLVFILFLIFNTLTFLLNKMPINGSFILIPNVLKSNP